MAAELNLTFQLGETWALPFDYGADLTGAALTFDLALGDAPQLSLSGDATPPPFALNTPPDGGMVTITPADQVGLTPETYLYEVRAVFADGRITVVQFGRVLVGDSLFSRPQVNPTTSEEIR